MGTLLTFVTAVAGLTVVGLGFRRYLRARFARRNAAPSAERRMRTARIVTAIGTVLALFPYLPTALLLDSGTTGGWGEALSLVGRIGYTLLLALPLAAVWLTIALTSRRVVDPVTAQARKAAVVVGQVVPSTSAAQARALRRDPRFAELPSTWEQVLATHRTLTRRLLDYQRDLDAARALPAMADLAVPSTAAAWEALWRCDDLRAESAPAGVTDPVRSAYGQAVGHFGAAVNAAEAYAHQLVTSGFVGNEHALVNDAERLLAYVRSNYTTPSERSKAYATIAAQLSDAADSVAAGSGPGRSHPWLDVEQRAR